ncbi:hypothetical protein ENBRE01_2234 [Enteropsectra breve]|nr:hypothetical protein ENBRE01_1232 [Enteropsectra breve]KAI5151580.1 hypothetical protein ENBRE01_2234 [Enteropsectra breve]
MGPSIGQDMKEDEEKKMLFKELVQIKAQLSLTQNKLKTAEGENVGLRQLQSDTQKRRIEEEEKLKRRLKMYENEYRLRQANIESEKYFKEQNEAKRPPSQPSCSNTPVFIDSKIDARHALKNSIDLKNMADEHEIEKIRFFRDYFFDDFYSLDAEQIKEGLKAIPMGKERNFVELFSIFACKKEVFDVFLLRCFEIPGYIERKCYILTNVPSEWLVAHDKQIPSVIQAFISSHLCSLLQLFIKITETRPSILSMVLSQSQFDSLIKIDSAEASHFVSAICRRRGLGFINESNFHFLSPEEQQVCCNE